VAPGLDLESIGRIDFVVISHNHYDHLDLSTLKTLADGDTPFLVPLANTETLNRHGIGPLFELDWWESIQIGDARIDCVPARHWSRRAITDMNRSLWGGWVVRIGDRAVYFAGDTGMFPGFVEIGERLGPIDLAMMPIGAYEPRAMMEPAHLNPEEAIAAVLATKAVRSVAMHFGTFELSEEPLHEPPERFVRASEAAGRGSEVDWVFKIGETRKF
jgi:N-acyl-phosphatidylethanolamine-hydrolysing phospholipase D